MVLITIQKWQNCSSRQLSNCALASLQSNSTLAELDLAKSQNKNSPRYDSGHLLPAGNDTAKEPKSEEGTDMLALNRGNAMLRYMEKKKTRRQYFRYYYSHFLWKFNLLSLYMSLLTQRNLMTGTINTSVMNQERPGLIRANE